MKTSSPYITKIKIEGFLPHRSTEIKLKHDGITVISGENGAGKTSIIDAICLCLTGKDSQNSSFEYSRVDPEGSGVAYIGLQFSDNSTLERIFPATGGQTRVFTDSSGVKSTFPSQVQLETAIPWISEVNKYILVPELASTLSAKQLQKLFFTLVSNHSIVPTVSQLMYQRGLVVENYESLDEKSVSDLRKSIKSDSENYATQAQYLRGAIELVESQLQETEGITLDSLVDAEAALLAATEIQRVWDAYDSSVKAHTTWAEQKSMLTPIPKPDLEYLDRLSARIKTGEGVVSASTSKLKELVKLEQSIASELRNLERPDSYVKEVISINSEIESYRKAESLHKSNVNQKCPVCKGVFDPLLGLPAIQQELIQLGNRKLTALKAVDTHKKQLAVELAKAQSNIKEHESILKSQIDLLDELKQEKTQLSLENNRYARYLIQLNSLGDEPKINAVPEYLRPTDPNNLPNLQKKAIEVRMLLDQRNKHTKELSELQAKYEHNSVLLQELDTAFTYADNLLQCIRLAPSAILKQKLSDINFDSRLIIEFNDISEETSEDLDPVELYYIDNYKRKVPVNKLSRGLRIRASLELQKILRSLTWEARRKYSNGNSHDWLPIIVDNVDAVTWDITFPTNSIVLTSSDVTSLVVDYFE